RAGEAALLAEYPGTEEVLAAAAAVRELAPAHLIDLVPAERTLLLAGAEAQDLPVLAALLEDLPPAASQHSDSGEVTVDVVYDGEDLAEVADLLGMSVQALIAAHSGTIWTAAFGGFAPGFAYLLPDAAHPGSAARPGRGARSHHGPRSGDTPRPGGPPWEVPRRAEPRTAVPVGAVGLASRYCGIYPRSSPGGWQLIGRSDAPLFDPDREPPALLTPGTRVRFAPQRSTARLSTTTSTLAQAAREAAAVPGRLGRRRPAAGPRAGHPAVDILSPGPLTLLQDVGRPGRAASGVSRAGAFDRGALLRANLAVGNPAAAAALEILGGGLLLRARAATVLALSGARAPLTLHRADEEGTDLELDADEAHELPLALDPGDRLELGTVTEGLRLVLAVRGGLHGTGEAGPVLGSLSRDTLSGLGPAPLEAGDVLLVGPERGLDAVPTPVRSEEHTSALQSPYDLPFFPTRRCSDLTGSSWARSPRGCAWCSPCAAACTGRARRVPCSARCPATPSPGSGPPRSRPGTCCSSGPSGGWTPSRRRCPTPPQGQDVPRPSSRSRCMPGPVTPSWAPLPSTGC